MNGKTCPLSPTRSHRVYYSARRHGMTSTIGQVATCRDCGVDVYLIGDAWQPPPPGEILIGLMAQFQARMIEGDPDSSMFGKEPRGIFGAAGNPRPTIVPAMPRISS